MLAKADSSVKKELDLVKFIHRQRVLNFAALVTLSGNQRYMVDKMATPLIRESSDLDDSTSSDEELDQVNFFDSRYEAQKMVASSDNIDRRLI